MLAVTLVLLTASSDGDALTLQRMADLAVARAPQVHAARARLEAAQAGVAEAQAGILPRVQLNARYTRLSEIDNDPLVALSIDLDAARAGTAQITDPAARAVIGAQIDQLAGLAQGRIVIPQNQYAFSAQLDYPASQLFFEILPGVEARSKSATAAALDVDVVRNVVALEAMEALLGHARAQRALQVARRAEARAKTNLDAARARAEVGQASRPDVLRFEARSAEAQGAVAAREADVQRSAVAVRTLAGLPGQGPAELAASVFTAPESSTGDAATWVEKAYAERDELEALSERTLAGARAADAAAGAMLPTLAASARVDYANPNNLFVPPGDEFRTSWSLSAVLSWSPDGAWAAHKATDAARARARETRALMEALRDLVRIEVHEAHARRRAAEQGWAAAKRSAAAAETGYEAVREGYELGVFDATDLIDSELQLERARLGVIDASVSFRIWQVRLQFRSGARLWQSGG